MKQLQNAQIFVGTGPDDTEVEYVFDDQNNGPSNYQIYQMIMDRGRLEPSMVGMFQRGETARHGDKFVPVSHKQIVFYEAHDGKYETVKLQSLNCDLCHCDPDETQAPPNEKVRVTDAVLIPLVVILVIGLIIVVVFLVLYKRRSKGK